MASTYTPAGIELIADGEQSGTWGQTTNTNWELIEELATGLVSITLTGTTYTLTTSDGTSSEGRHAIIKFTGSPGGTCTVTVSPNDMQKVYWIVNTSDQTVTLTQGSGSNVSVLAGSKKVMYCDGAGAGAAVVDLSQDLDIAFNDGDKLTFGDSEDFEISHDGTDNILNSDNGDIKFQFTDTSSVEMTSTGIKTDQIDELTSANGVVIDGVTLKDGGATVTADVNFGDNDKAIFGAGSDLQIYHNGTHSYVHDTGTGNLRLLGTDVQILNSANNEVMAGFNDNGGVSLYYDNSKKLATTSTGIDVTGTVTADGLNLDGDISSFGSTSQSITLERNSVSKISIGASTSGTGNYINAEINDLNFSRTASLIEVMTIRNSTGDIIFYDDTGTEGMRWDASAEHLGIGLASPSAKLHVYNSTAVGGTAGDQLENFFIENGGGTEIRFRDIRHTNGSDWKTIDSRIHYSINDNSTKQMWISFYNQNAIEDNIMRFGEGEDTEWMRIDNGKVGIGTDDPSQILTVAASGSSARISITDTDTIATSMTGLLEFDGSDTRAGFIGYNAGNLELQTDGADNIIFNTDGSEAMRIDSSGQVGIGTSSPDATLEVQVANGGGDAINLSRATTTDTFGIRGDNAGILEWRAGGSYGGGGIRMVGGLQGGADEGTISFHAGSGSGGLQSERMRITSSGNVKIGTDADRTSFLTQSSANLQIGGGLIFEPNSGNNAEILNYRSTATVFGNGGSEQMRISSGGNVGIGTSSPAYDLDVTGYLRVATSGSNAQIRLERTNTSTGHSWIGASSGALLHVLDSSFAETMRVTTGGDLLIAKTTSALASPGHTLSPLGLVYHTRANGALGGFNRTGNDGGMVYFYQDGNAEGYVSVSGTTVSYNGGHLARWSQLADNTKDESIVKGTVLTNLDQMAVWHHEAVEAQDAVLDEEGNVVTEAVEAKEAYTEDNEQLNCMAVSSVEGDPNVAGVFVNWDDDDDEFNDMNIAMTGDMVIRIAQGTTVQRGDLLMSAGDGTAKPQGDDIVRSKTIAKVTSTNVSHTYDDGSYLVPCVLMAC
jgi:hypothetical protein